MSDLIPAPAPTAAAPVSLGDLLATLTGTPTPFVEVALAHPRTPPAQIRAGLLQLQEEGAAYLVHGAGWYRKLSHVEQLAEDLPCEKYNATSRRRGYSCRTDSGLTPNAPFSADRYCDPCRLRHAIELDRKAAQ